MMMAIGSYLLLVIAVCLVAWVVFVIPYKPWDNEDDNT